jgi:hypothetical protein
MLDYAYHSIDVVYIEYTAPRDNKIPLADYRSARRITSQSSSAMAVISS